MKKEERYCTNCRSAIPTRAETCPECGVFAGDLFDGRTDVQKRATRRRQWALFAVLVIAAGAVASWYFLRDRSEVRALFERPAAEAKKAEAPIRVVRDRPGITRHGSGAAISEPEAILLLRRTLASQLSPAAKPIGDECVAILSNGFRAGFYLLTAVNRCDQTRLGRWQVNAKTREVSRLAIGP